MLDGHKLGLQLSRGRKTAPAAGAKAAAKKGQEVSERTSPGSTAGQIDADYGLPAFPYRIQSGCDTVIVRSFSMVA